MIVGPTLWGMSDPRDQPSFFGVSNFHGSKRRIGIANEPRPDHAAYIASWLEVLNQDRRAVFTAAAKANEAAAYLRTFSETDRV